jgi:hypothetical protein
MKQIIEVKGRVYESSALIKERFDVSTMTLARWVGRELLPPPLRLGRTNFYDRHEVEARIAKGE